MRKEAIETINKILDSGAIGYARLYPAEEGGKKEYLISLTPENIARLIGSCGDGIKRIEIMDMAEWQLMTVESGGIESSDQKLKGRVMECLEAGRREENQKSDYLAVSREIADLYFYKGDQAVTMAEVSMM